VAAAFQRFNVLTQHVLEAKHNFLTNTFKLFLTNTAPNSEDSFRSDLVEIAAGNGYPLLGIVAPVVLLRVGTKTTISAPPVIIAASGGSVGPFQYVVLYNSTSGTRPLVGWWDYGSPVTLQSSETLTVQFDALNGVFSIDIP
jgi:hypothetical protein